MQIKELRQQISLLEQLTASKSKENEILLEQYDRLDLQNRQLNEKLAKIRQQKTHKRSPSTAELDTLTQNSGKQDSLLKETVSVEDYQALQNRYNQKISQIQLLEQKIIQIESVKLVQPITVNLQEQLSQLEKVVKQKEQKNIELEQSCKDAQQKLKNYFKDTMTLTDNYEQKLQEKQEQIKRLNEVTDPNKNQNADEKLQIKEQSRPQENSSKDSELAQKLCQSNKKIQDLQDFIDSKKKSHQELVEFLNQRVDMLTKDGMNIVLNYETKIEHKEEQIQILKLQITNLMEKTVKIQFQNTQKSQQIQNEKIQAQSIEIKIQQQLKQEKMEEQSISQTNQTNEISELTLKIQELQNQIKDIELRNSQYIEMIEEFQSMINSKDETIDQLEKNKDYFLREIQNLLENQKESKFKIHQKYQEEFRLKQTKLQEDYEKIINEKNLQISEMIKKNTDLYQLIEKQKSIEPIEEKKEEKLNKSIITMDLADQLSQMAEKIQQKELEVESMTHILESYQEEIKKHNQDMEQMEEKMKRKDEEMTLILESIAHSHEEQQVIKDSHQKEVKELMDNLQIEVEEKQKLTKYNKELELFRQQTTQKLQKEQQNLQNQEKNQKEIESKQMILEKQIIDLKEENQVLVQKLQESQQLNIQSLEQVSSFCSEVQILKINIREKEAFLLEKNATLLENDKTFEEKDQKIIQQSQFIDLLEEQNTKLKNQLHQQTNQLNLLKEQNNNIRLFIIQLEQNNAIKANELNSMHQKYKDFDEGVSRIVKQPEVSDNFESPHLPDINTQEQLNYFKEQLVQKDEKIKELIEVNAKLNQQIDQKNVQIEQMKKKHSKVINDNSSNITQTLSQKQLNQQLEINDLKEKYNHMIKMFSKKQQPQYYQQNTSIYSEQGRHPMMFNRNRFTGMGEPNDRPMNLGERLMGRRCRMKKSQMEGCSNNKSFESKYQNFNSDFLFHNQ